jgi:hypothetical protein
MPLEIRAGAGKLTSPCSTQSWFTTSASCCKPIYAIKDYSPRHMVTVELVTEAVPWIRLPHLWLSLLRNLP